MNSRKVLVTGGSRGIGRAIVQRCIEDGFDVFNFSRTPPAQLMDGETFFAVDLTDTEKTRQAIQQLISQNVILHLVNNAGFIIVDAAQDVVLADYQRMWALNVQAPLMLVQALLPVMRSNRYGRIVNIGSRAALGKPGRTGYGATKAALAGMTRTWSLEFAADAITVNTVSPGPIATEMFLTSNPSDSPQTKKLQAQIPVERIGTPDEVAHAVSMFLDPRAGYITGQELYVCGGMTVGTGS